MRCKKFTWKTSSSLPRISYRTGNPPPPCGCSLGLGRVPRTALLQMPTLASGRRKGPAQGHLPSVAQLPQPPGGQSKGSVILLYQMVA